MDFRVSLLTLGCSFWLELKKVFEQAHRDGAVRVVVLASALPKLFTAGLDSQYLEVPSETLLNVSSQRYRQPPKQQRIRPSSAGIGLTRPYSCGCTLIVVAQRNDRSAGIPGCSVRDREMLETSDCCCSWTVHGTSHRHSKYCRYSICGKPTRPILCIPYLTLRRLHRQNSPSRFALSRLICPILRLGLTFLHTGGRRWSSGGYWHSGSTPKDCWKYECCP